MRENLKFLRKRRKKTQDDVAYALKIKRSTLNSYENGICEPKLERLIALAEYYRISIDDMIRRELKKMPESKLRAVELMPIAIIEGVSND
ncbi:helix-turn-helix transcriptional regulator [Adhaeribacter sp. BT258]|uniref:Helix-turn-helix transcriptional regulator n=1 Tax=Adhaeribacter terrigena TaxID=2793070 RepID=A0ABS1C0Z6_9BACT|nr:helix-turn-helix transcriptional regulator [Adhaeribacter terrigena]MBK0403075.1 helix-turn-helix transcriptional regulator [Adhaeribacter terrigena]